MCVGICLCSDVLVYVLMNSYDTTMHSCVRTLTTELTTDYLMGERYVRRAHVRLQKTHSRTASTCLLLLDVTLVVENLLELLELCLLTLALLSQRLELCVGLLLLGAQLLDDVVRLQLLLRQFLA